VRGGLGATSVDKSSSFSSPKFHVPGENPPPPSAMSLEKIVPRRGAFRFVKPSGGSLGEVERPLVTATYDSRFMKFTPNRPFGYTFSFLSAGEGRDRQIADQDLGLPRRPRSTGRRTATRRRIGATSVDKPSFSSSPKFHVPGENRPSPRGFSLCQALRRQSRGGREASRDGNLRQRFPEIHAKSASWIHLLLLLSR
jgi:hypothetical protein